MNTDIPLHVFRSWNNKQPQQLGAIGSDYDREEGVNIK